MTKETLERLMAGKTEVEMATLGVGLVSDIDDWIVRASAIITLYTSASDFHSTRKGIEQIIREQYENSLTPVI